MRCPCRADSGTVHFCFVDWRLWWSGSQRHTAGNCVAESIADGITATHARSQRHAYAHASTFGNANPYSHSHAQPCAKRYSDANPVYDSRR